jgi:dTDP-4-amino-4,6-dideoxygalactose transaminase
VAMNPHVPFNQPLFLEEGMVNMRKAFENQHISGDGEFTRKCQGFFERALGVRRALLTTSCTDALEMCALLLDIQPGDEVILPSYTFVSSANAFVLRGAKPVFVDVRPDTLNIDEAQIEAAITPRTKAIVVVHYAGVACEMDAICRVASQRGISVVEDNAHGLFGKYRGRPLGTFGLLAVLSFHETKNLSCGEGGALLINGDRYLERAEVLREKGTDRSRFFRGEVDKYTWRDLGSSFLPSDLLAALLWTQVERQEEIQSRRREIHERYSAGLGGWASESGARLPVVPQGCEQSFHMFYLLLPSADAQGALIRHLAASQINSVFHYQPLHLTPMGLRLGGRPGQCPVAESAAARIVRLPFYFGLDAGQQQRVIDGVTAFRC